MASYSLAEFLGEGVLKELGGRLAEDGWDDVPTLKVMRAQDMDALALTHPQRDALELRIHLHNRSLMKYADTLEASGLGLVALMSTKPSELASKFRMRRTHVATFIDTSTSCSIIQMPPGLLRSSKPSENHGNSSPIKRPLPFQLHKSIVSDASSFGSSKSDSYASTPRKSYASPPRKSNASMGYGKSYPSPPRKSYASPPRKSNASTLNPKSYPSPPRKSYASPPRKSNASMGYGKSYASPPRKSNGSMGYGRLNAGSPRKSDASVGYEMPSLLRPLDATKPNAPKGVFSATNTSRRMCGLVKKAAAANAVAKLSVLEKVCLRPLAPDHRNGVDATTLKGVRKLQPFKASNLWSNKATLFFCIRRPGCVMCRAEAHQLFARKPIFDALGIQLVAVLLEDIDEEVWAFWPRYWAGMVVLDEKKDFFRALGGGKLMKDNLFTGFLLNPTAHLNWKRATKTGIQYNNIGDGLIKGGLFIVRRGKGGVAYQFAERNFGDWAPLDEVLQVCHIIREEGDIYS